MRSAQKPLILSWSFNSLILESIGLRGCRAEKAVGDSSDLVIKLSRDIDASVSIFQSKFASTIMIVLGRGRTCTSDPLGLLVGSESFHR